MTKKQLETNDIAFNCPVCGSPDFERIFPLYKGDTVSSDFNVIKDAVLDNRCCKDCGLIFNAKGTRGFTEEFYKNSYKLMLRKENAEIQSFAAKKPISQAERSCQIMLEMIQLPDSGKILEIGAGKGDFLGFFAKSYNDWDITAFEPSQSYDVLKERYPDWNIVQSDYDHFPLEEGTYDVVVALGVLEHVTNPLDMLKWAFNGLKENGKFFIRVPNFGKNPNDLLCVDHLSKLSVDSIKNIAGAAGFEIMEARELGVPVFTVLVKTGQTLPLENFFESNVELAEKNSEFVTRSLEAVLQCRNSAKEKNENFGIFGMASPALFAPLYYDFDPKEITAYIDENKTIWGSEVHGCPVGGLEYMVEQNIKHVAIVISPVYIEQVSQKLRKLAVNIYTP